MAVAQLQEASQSSIHSPIIFEYTSPDRALLDALTSQAKLIVIPESPYIKLYNAYHRMQYPGTSEKMYTRESIYERLLSISNILAPQAGLLLFDAYRSIPTQVKLFESFKSIVANSHPEFDEDQVTQEALNYVSHPYDTSRFDVPLHHTGGAVDCLIYDLQSGEPWDFGTEIDTLSALSHTHFFEQAHAAEFQVDTIRWQRVRHNRRTLFHLMKEHDFVNFSNEWWHYDLGNSNWGSQFGLTPIYGAITPPL